MSSPVITKTFTNPDPKPAHHKQGGGFVNPWPSAVDHGFGAVGKMMYEWVRTTTKMPPPEERVKVTPPDFAAISAMNSEGRQSKVMLTWLGHAAILMSYPGLNVLLDPCFSDRCSPISFAGPQRLIPPPCDISALPPIDIVIISHNHYDHLDLPIIKKLAQPHTHFFVPLGNKAWFDGIGIKNVIECDWWDEYEFKKANGKTAVVGCTPCQHFSGRTLSDRNKTLWSSWIVKANDTSFFFGGDTGYRAVTSDDEDLSKLPVCPEFKKIGEKYGPFNLAAIPIGAYAPRWFMSPIHCSPEDAVCVHQDVKSKRSVGIHWGTYPMTMEPYYEPPERLKAALKAAGLPETEFHIMHVGEWIEV